MESSFFKNSWIGLFQRWESDRREMPQITILPTTTIDYTSKSSEKKGEESIKLYPFQIASHNSIL
jgi:hypothetical protein